MDYLSEVLKIIDGALRANASMASSYAGLLADKLEKDGQRSQARMVRDRLARAPQALLSTQDGSLGTLHGNLPTDGESRLHTVDVALPSESEIPIVLASGLERRLREFLESVQHHERLAAAGVAQPSRMLIYGPPGTGKTQMARHVAARLGLPLFTVRCDTLISSLLGQTSRNLRRVFEYVQQMPSVLFLDEFDALASARGSERDVGELQRIVIALLQNIDALPLGNVLLAATNHDELLDRAVWRRFSVLMPMPMPGPEARLELWRQKLGDFAPKEAIWDDLVNCSAGTSGAVIEQVSLDAKRVAVLSQSSQVDVDELFRRLALSQAIVSGHPLSTEDDEIRYLRSWDSRRFSLRCLAALYQVSIRHITNLTKGVSSDGNQEARAG